MTESDDFQEKYEKLLKKYNQLKKETSENVVIQSMNDMKLQYDHLVSHSVPLYKYNMIYERYIKFHKVLSSAGVLIDHIVKCVKGLESLAVMTEVKSGLYKTNFELMLLKEILEEPVCEGPVTL